MAAYMIVDNEITDPEGFREYQKRVGSTLESYGGTFLVRGEKYENLEGDWHLHQLILLSFPVWNRPGVGISQMSMPL